LPPKFFYFLGILPYHIHYTHLSKKSQEWEMGKNAQNYDKKRRIFFAIYTEAVLYYDAG